MIQSDPSANCVSILANGSWEQVGFNENCTNLLRPHIPSMAAILEHIASPNFSRDDELPMSFQEPSIDPLDSTESSSEESPFQMTQVADTIWTFVFSTMIVSAIFGNLVVFWIVLAHRRMQNVTNYFLVNLSLADLMMSCLNTIFNFIFMKNRTWIFGSVYCTINNFIAYLSVAVSVFTLMAISIDRYIAIVRPLKPRMSKTCARIFLLAIWVTSSILSLPSLLYSTTWTFAYNILYFVLTYCVPIIAMGVCYGRIGTVLWGKGIIRENASSDMAQERKLLSKRKVVKMFIVVVIIFAVCWLPYHIYFIYTYHHKEIVAQPFIQHVYLGFYWLAMANAMFNPLIYYWMNARFRGYFLALISSIRLIICQPSRLFKRSDSKSSLTIGVVPVNRGVVKMELAQIAVKSHQKRSQQNMDKALPGERAQCQIQTVKRSPGRSPSPFLVVSSTNEFQAPVNVQRSLRSQSPRLGCHLEIVGSATSDSNLYRKRSTDSTRVKIMVKSQPGSPQDFDDSMFRVAIPFRNNPVLRYP
ncbi:hypothetical protein TCAL_03201 [Tigriopus californicus]|uniref:G-protein coupled receptors family 1 profile domain-containing protein n=1 Tax=Tigriopus californicus TaxID=6832 RepID=A0A553N720_TIGCA|nr:hypothetical protein TCAL_03201 [Tigriopus californicus]|eukprot:TCALIF_03201-PA protein Name:"Similar to TkR86C Tachykinin-like peptides receptor 86C (Drosophila melanogaster)" AED:0.06 eAED:0.05 QI:219/0.77/0.5/1/0.33/0.3/10/202/528